MLENWKLKTSLLRWKTKMVNIKPKRRKPSVTTSSMSDIGFLLLIFIMLISLMNQRKEEKIEYSEATLIEKTQVDKNFEIWIKSDGMVFVEGENVDGATLESLIVKAVTEQPLTRVHIIADKNTPYKYVDSTVKILQKLEHRVVSFVVREKL